MFTCPRHSLVLFLSSHPLIHLCICLCLCFRFYFLLRLHLCIHRSHDLQVYPPYSHHLRANRSPIRRSTYTHSSNIRKFQCIGQWCSGGGRHTPPPPTGLLPPSLPPVAGNNTDPPYLAEVVSPTTYEPPCGGILLGYAQSRGSSPRSPIQKIGLPARPYK